MSILCKCLYDNKTTIVVWLSNGQFTYHICIFPFHASSSSFNAVLYLLPPWHNVKVAKKAKDTILSSPPSLTKHSRTWFHWGAEWKQTFKYGDDRSEVKNQKRDIWPTCRSYVRPPRCRPLRVLPLMNSLCNASRYFHLYFRKRNNLNRKKR